MTCIPRMVRAATLLLSAVASASAQEYWKPPIPDGPFTSTPRPFEYITPDGSRDSADVASFRVPARYDGTSRDSLTLVYVRLRSRAHGPTAPIVYLSGGPGSSAIALSGFQQMRFFENLRAAGDVILLDQRGSGRSEPQSRCEGKWNMPTDLALNDRRLTERLVAQGQRCASALRRRGVDLAALTTANIADDVEQLRRTLHVPRVDIFWLQLGKSFRARDRTSSSRWGRTPHHRRC